MATLVLDGVPPWDGSYEFDFEFTNRELYDIKNICGIRAGELIEALDTNDTGAYVAVGVVVLKQHGQTVDPDDLWGGKVGSVSISLNGAAAGPPTTPPSGPDPGVPAGSSGASSDAGGG